MTNLWNRLAFHQVRRPWMIVIGFLALASVAGWRSTRLRLITDFSDLLPADQPSVVELHRILGKIHGLSNIFVVLEGPRGEPLRRVADRLVQRLPAIGSPYVELVRSGVQRSRAFLMPRAALFLPEQELAQLEAKVSAQEREAFRRSIGADLDDGAADTAAPVVDVAEISRRLLGRSEAMARYPDGYFQAEVPGGVAQVVVVQSAVPTGDLEGSREAIARVSQTVAATLKELAADSQGLRVGYAGDLVTGSAEYAMVRRDVLDVGLLGLGLILAVVLLFFRTPRALVELGATIAVGCVLTFGFTELTLGHLNVATAFLLSIVAGNGINFGIIWLARFREERRAGKDLEAAVARALATTAGATLTAAAAAATAYAALGTGTFRGFRHFALIGASGMVFCWLVSYALLPSLVVLLERRKAANDLRGHPVLTPFERPFVWLVDRAPGTTLLLTLGLGVVGLLAGGSYLARGALEYDMKKLRSDPVTTGELYRVSDVARRVLASAGSAGMVVMTTDPRDTPVLAKLLRQRRDAAPAALKPFEDVHTVDDWVPADQAARLPRLHELARRLTRAHERGAIDDDAWARLGPLLPPADLRPFTIADLPRELTEPFTEKDGTLGRVLYIEATHGQTDSDLHYLLRWADAFRRTQLPDGRVVHGSGYAVIFADLLTASLVDMPRSVMTSLALTALAVALFFGRPRATASVLATLALALIWMMGALALGDVRLSFINFIALPVTFGIGVDYPVNVYGRYVVDGRRRGGMLTALQGTGGAVILCSLTTSLGYLALLRAHNQAVRSLGLVAVIGEVSCLLASVLFLPAALTWGERRARARTIQPDV